LAASPLHARLPINWPVAPPTPFGPGPNGLRAILAALRRDLGYELVPNGPLDPVAIPHLPNLTSRGRLALLDRLHAAARPTDPQVIDRFIDAYLLLANRGFVQIPGSPRRRALAKATLRAVELMNRLFRDAWHRQMAAPPGWWRRFLETFRAAGEARLFAIRRPLFQGADETTVLHAAGATLLHSATNPFAWEPELVPYLERLVNLFGEDVLLFPAASPSAYAEGRPGRFVFDVNDDHPPGLPERWAPRSRVGRERTWWIMDTSRVLARIAEFRRNLALGISPERIHATLADIPEPSRGILLRRLEKVLSRSSRRGRSPSQGQAHVVPGLEATVRHSFARRWSGTRDPSILDTNVRLQSEVGTRGSGRSALHRWQIMDRHPTGMRLHGPDFSGPPIIGQVAGVLEIDPDGRPSDGALRAGIVRWQRASAEEKGTEIGLELFPQSPEDCWCRMARGPGSTLHEYPALLLPAGSRQGPSLLLPAGLFQAGGLVTLRTDNQDQLAELIQVLEMGVHFEHIEVRLNRPE